MRAKTTVSKIFKIFLVFLIVISYSLNQPLGLIKTEAAPKDNNWLTYKLDGFSRDTVDQLFKVMGSASVPEGQNFIRLTPASTLQSGAVITKNNFCPKDNYSFSTAFSFKTGNTSPDGASDGFTFTLQANQTNPLNNGGSLGIHGTAPSFSVKYDTFTNDGYNDPSDNNIGLAVNGDPVNKSGWFTDLNQYNTTNGTNYDLSNGTQYYTWIDYDGLNKNVQVRLGTSPDRASSQVVLDVNSIDLDSIFNGAKPYASFTGTTGSPNYETHDIYNWYFVNQYAPIDTLNPQNDYKQAPSSLELAASTDNGYNATVTLLDPLGKPVQGASLDSFTSTIGELTGPNGEAVTDLVSDADGKIQAELNKAGHNQEVTLAAAYDCFTDSTSFTSTNQPPTAPDDTKTTAVNEPVSGQVEGQDPDGDSLTYRAGNQQPSNGKVTVNEDGTWTYTPNKDYVGDDTFTVIVDDGYGGTAEATITIHVTPTPILESKKSSSIEKKADGNTDASNPEVGDTLLYTIETRNTLEKSSVTNLTITDDIPEGVEYVSGTLTVDGKAVTDAQGDDKGHFADGQVVGQFGDVTDTEWHTLTFQVTVNEDQAGQTIPNTAVVKGDNIPTPDEPKAEVIISPKEDIDACARPVALINGSFEEPPARMPGDTGSPGAEQYWMYFYENEVPGWKTTASDKFIQIMKNEYIYNGYTINPPNGNQYAELNAEQVSALYQDVETTPGQTIYWRLAHKGLLGVDTMSVQIGSTDTPIKDLPVIQEISTGNTEWKYYSGSYTVPAGQTTTRFAFNSVDATGGNQRFGNLLDDIFLGTEPCVVAEKTVSPKEDVFAGDELTYEVNVKNTGGDIAADAVFEDAIPEGTEYVPGSLKITNGPGKGDLTDEKDDDAGQIDGEKVIVKLGDLANTTDLPDGITVQFKVKALSTETEKVVVNKALINYENLLVNEKKTTETNEVKTTVLPKPEIDACARPVALINGSFEEGPARGSYQSSGIFFYEDEVPGWKTTDDAQGVKIIEIWNHKEDLPATAKNFAAPVDGDRWAELNAFENGMLYQDVETTPGQTLYWRLSHMGRQGVDTMQVRIGQATSNPYDTVPQTQMSTGNTAWKTYTGTYTVPAGQTTTRFGFEAVKTANGNLGAGNFLDDIFLGTEPCVVPEKTVSPEGEVNAGDELTYEVNVKNNGGDIAADALFEDAIPEGTEYVPGSLKITNGTGTIDLTDADDKDAGHFDGQKVIVKLGDLPNTNNLPNGMTVQFKVKALVSETITQVKNKAQIDYKNLLTNEDEVVDSNEVTTPLTYEKPVLESKKSAAIKEKADGNTDTEHPEVGDTLTYTIQTQNTVSNSLVKNMTIKD
ncbi:hypothetical protein CHH62_22045, partial [Niallia circulans]|uniref:isopeptide-forming domain-containing fimbrial protein n=1 Tax=Niallia circulans TaxID=1397 RepID=UPI000BC55073